MKTASIVGGAGYTAGELLRLLLRHPQVDLVSVGSYSHAGEPLWKAHSDLFGETDRVFSAEVEVAVDVLFLCMGHGHSQQWLASHPVPQTTAIIDLSQDFRLKSSGEGRAWTYGLPEAFPEKPEMAIANPGCFATAIQLALLPLAAAKELTSAVHIQGITGSTGAGVKPSPTGHFSWRNNNVSVYKAFQHQHLHEIRQTLRHLQPGFAQPLNFIPIRGNFTRGILVTAYTPSDREEVSLQSLYDDYYEDAPFVHCTSETVHLKQVVGTNKGLVQVEKQAGQAFVTVAIDNLLKGASGQAVHNMNRLFGWPAESGLKLKAIAF